MKKIIVWIFLVMMGTIMHAAPTYEYRRELREPEESGQI